MSQPDYTPKPEDRNAERHPVDTRPARMEPLATLPVFLKLKGRRAVVAGGSEAAAWKVELLSAAGAEVDVYAPLASQQLRDVAAAPPDGPVTLHARRWQDDDFSGAEIVIGAITNETEAQTFAAAARAHGVLVNVVDSPEYCAFQFGAIVNRSPLVVAISTDGGAPVFAQAIRSRLEALLPQGFKAWAEVAKRWRQQGARLGATLGERRRFWENFARRAFAQSDRGPDDSDLAALIEETERQRLGQTSEGFVSLVGAGPGDPELLTLKAVRALRAADVILYDDLVSAPILEFARREARRILVGKTGYGPACKQAEINAMMVTLAREGHRVVRLKSGDPMIFGRAGEEMDELNAAGIAFEVVPGISAVQAAAAALKVSLTHRDLARRVQFVTGHSREGRLPETLDWSSLADPCATTAVYMPQRTLAELRDRLVEAGLPASTPAMAIFSVSRTEERRLADTIGTLPEALDGLKAQGPCLVLIGAVLGRNRSATAMTNLAASDPVAAR